MSDLIQKWKNHGCSFCNYNTTELTDEIERLEADLAYAKSWGCNQYANLKADNERLLAALQDIQHRAPTNGEDVSFAIANKALAEQK